MTNNVSKVRDMCYTAIFTALIAVMAQIQVPMAGGVPVTLQTFAVAFSGIVLGGKRGAAACLVYLVLGAVGVPVFAGFKGGLGSVLNMTGGFLISFPLFSFCAGIAADKAWGFKGAKRYCVIAVGLIVGAALNYAVGTVWFSVITGNTLWAGFAACVAPFLVNDIIKLILAGWAGLAVVRVLSRTGLLVRA